MFPTGEQRFEPSPLSIILILASVSSVVFSPFIGRLVDQVDAKRQLVCRGNFFVVAIGFFPYLIAYSTARPSTTATLIAVVIATTIANGIVGGSHDYFVKAISLWRRDTACSAA
jgi:hypothetical protein